MTSKSKLCIESTCIERTTRPIVGVNQAIVAVFFGFCIFFSGITSTPAEQQPSNMQSTKASNPPRIHKSLQRKLEPLLQQLRERGLPTQPLIDKAREGIAKSIDDAGIVRVCTQLASYLEEAGNVLQKKFKTRRRKSVPVDLMRAYAEARLSGVTREETKTILSASNLPAGRAIAATGLYLAADLNISGYPTVETSAIVALLISRGDTKSLDILKSELAFVRKRYGLTEAQAARALRSAIQKHKTPMRAFQSIRRGHDKHQQKERGPGRHSKHSR